MYRVLWYVLTGLALLLASPSFAGEAANAIPFPFVDAPYYDQEIIYTAISSPYDYGKGFKNGSMFVVGQVVTGYTPEGPLVSTGIVFSVWVSTDACQYDEQESVSAVVGPGPTVTIARSREGTIDGISFDGLTIYLLRSRLLPDQCGTDVGEYAILKLSPR